LTVPTNDKNSGKLTGSVFYRKLAVVIIGTENCESCDAWNEDLQACMQDENLGGTGHGDESLSDADHGL
jgi:hypothetical protein